MLKKTKLLLLAVLLTSGCSCSYQENLKTKIKQEHDYKLVSFGMLKMAVPKRATISFKDGTYSGYAGCNGMSGKYEVDGNKIKFHSGMSTMMACDDMMLETKFRKNLEDVDNYIVREGFVILRKNEQELLNFKEVKKIKK